MKILYIKHLKNLTSCAVLLALIDPDFHPRFSIVPLSASKQQICISSLKTTNNNKLQTKDLPDFTRRQSKEKARDSTCLKKFQLYSRFNRRAGQVFFHPFAKLAVRPNF